MRARLCRLNVSLFFFGNKSKSLLEIEAVNKLSSLCNQFEKQILLSALRVQRNACLRSIGVARVSREDAWGKRRLGQLRDKLRLHTELQLNLLSIRGKSATNIANKQLGNGLDE